MNEYNRQRSKAAQEAVRKMRKTPMTKEEFMAQCERLRNQRLNHRDSSKA
jgi:hypothetical protein